LQTRALPARGTPAERPPRDDAAHPEPALTSAAIPRLFIVRLWTDAGRFRAHVRAVQDGSWEPFDDPQRLAEHLAQQAASATDLAPTDSTRRSE
jgi:hypothetical protein